MVLQTLDHLHLLRSSLGPLTPLAPPFQEKCVCDSLYFKLMWMSNGVKNITKGVQHVMRHLLCEGGTQNVMEFVTVRARPDPTMTPAPAH